MCSSIAALAPAITSEFKGVTEKTRGGHSFSFNVISRMSTAFTLTSHWQKLFYEEAGNVFELDTVHPAKNLGSISEVPR